MGFVLVVFQVMYIKIMARHQGDVFDTGVFFCSDSIHQNVHIGSLDSSITCLGTYVSYHNFTMNPFEKVLKYNPMVHRLQVTRFANVLQFLTINCDCNISQQPGE